jgi:hypothetical protein
MTVSPIVKRERPASGRVPRADSQHESSDRTLFVGVVHAADGVRFAAATTARRDLVCQLAEYARERAEYALRPDHARHLQGLLARGETEAAVELYFALVGERWDEEWLVTTVVATDGVPDVTAVVGEVALPDALHEPRRLRDAS